MNTDRPWMTALEMQFAAMRVLHEHPDSDAARLKMELAHLKAATAYDWADDPMTAVRMASLTIPESTTLSEVNLEGSAGWWWFGDKDALPAAALLWARNVDGVMLSWYRLTDSSEPWAHLVWGWPFGDSVAALLADQVKNEPNDPMLRGDLRSMEILSRFFLAGCVWIHQRILTINSGHIERHRRKQLGREHDAEVLSDVKVIQLRRAESQSNSMGQSDPVEWSCRWIVNGHWRNQPYKDRRELIYILPFIKGPDDKPLKVPTHTVYEVSR